MDESEKSIIALPAKRATEGVSAQKLHIPTWGIFSEKFYSDGPGAVLLRRTRLSPGQ